MVLYSLMMFCVYSYIDKSIECLLQLLNVIVKFHSYNRHTNNTSHTIPLHTVHILSLVSTTHIRIISPTIEVMKCYCDIKIIAMVTIYQHDIPIICLEQSNDDFYGDHYYQTLVT